MWFSIVLNCVSHVRGDFQFAGSYEMLHENDCVCKGTVLLELQRDTSALKEREYLMDMFDVSFGTFQKTTMSPSCKRAYCYLKLVKMTFMVHWNVPRAFSKPNRIRKKRYKPWWEMIVVLSLSSSLIFTYQYLLSVPSVEKTVGSPSELVLLSLHGTRCDSRRVRFFNLR